MFKWEFIYWKRDVKEVIVKQKTFSTIYKFLKENGYRAEGRFTIRRTWMVHPFTYGYKKLNYTDRTIYLRTPNNYIRYRCNILDDSKNDSTVVSERRTGLKSRSIVLKLFKKENGVAFKKAFGYCDRNLINKCIPKQFYYFNDFEKDRLLHHCSKIDVSSNYPYHLCGRLPTAKDSIEVEGRAMPNEEYPFAFYIRTGHIAEYRKFDSHNWSSCYLSKWMYDKKKNLDIPDAEEVTILMKASEYTFDNIIKELYRMKNDNMEIDGIKAKMVMNSFIGTLHRKATIVDGEEKFGNSFRLDHIAAVVIGRANNSILGKCLAIGPHKILQIVVDSILYHSSKPYGSSRKRLGGYVQEFQDCDLIMRGLTQWVAFKNGEYVDCRHRGDMDLPKDYIPSTIEEIYDWTYKKRNDYYILMEELEDEEKH